jgi:(2Fe-2S) ferredoxin
VCLYLSETGARIWYGRVTLPRDRRMLVMVMIRGRAARHCSEAQKLRNSETPASKGLALREIP